MGKGASVKYCRACKIRIVDAALVCPQCGRPAAVFGARPVTSGSGPGVGPSLTLQGQIEQLQTLHRRQLSRSRWLALACVLVFFALAITLYLVYDAAVLSYAIIRNVHIEQDPKSETEVHVAFEVVKPGKVIFDRRSGKMRTEKLDRIARAGPYQLDWAWPSEVQPGIDFNVVYRAGIVRETVARHFNLTGKNGAPLDVVFILDITGSMMPFIQGLKKKCLEFADLVQRNGYDCHLGLVAFGDVEINEPFTLFEPTADIRRFQDQVTDLKLLDGGDEPESSVEALRQALELRTRSEAKVCFVHITDASCHHAEKLPGVAQDLEDRNITTYVVSRRELNNLYGPLCVHGGRFHAIQDAQFEEILLNVARSITNQIKVHQ
jgi:Mg-chelatase subunit ChlD